MDVQKTRKALDAKETKLLTGPANKSTEAKLRVFLENYARTGRVMRACEAAGIDHATHYRRMQTDATYRAAVEEAEQAVAQHIEDRVYDMSMDQLPAAIVLLKRFRPNHYRERSSVEVTGTLDLVDKLAQARERMLPLDADNDRTADDSQIC